MGESTESPSWCPARVASRDSGQHTMENKIIINICQTPTMCQAPCLHPHPHPVCSVWVPSSPVPCAPSLHQVKSLYLGPESATAGSPSASPRPPHYGSLPPAAWASPPGPLHPWSIQPHLLREALRHAKSPGWVRSCLRPWSGTPRFPSLLYIQGTRFCSPITPWLP